MVMSALQHVEEGAKVYEGDSFIRDSEKNIFRMLNTNIMR